MEKRRREDRVITLICFSISGIALAAGLWIAGAPLGATTEFRTAELPVVAEVR